MSTIGPRWPPENSSLSNDAVSITCAFEGSSTSESEFLGKKEEINRLTDTHFGHSLHVTVSAMSDDNQIVGLGIGIRRAKTAVGT